MKPTKTQEERLFQWLGTTRFVYNMCLDYKTTCYNAAKISLSKNQIQKELKEIRQETPWIKDVHSQVIQSVTDRLFTAYDAFFRRVKNGETPGFPRFAKSGKWSSFTFKQGVKYLPNTKRLKLPSFGSIRFRQSQVINGEIKNATIKHEADGWYISLCCKVNMEHKSKADGCVGIDVGVKDLVITSEGEVFDNPKTLRQYEKRLAKLQQSLSRKIKGSNNRKKLSNELKRLFMKIKRIRNDNLHKISTALINENQVICVEQLNIVGLTKRCKPKQDESGKYVHNGQFAKSGLNKSILDASWGMFFDMLKYKSIWAGRTFVEVPSAYTSKDCNQCGHRNHDLTLAVRQWTCEGCGAELDRDQNAAINILNKGLDVLDSGGGAHLLNLETHMETFESTGTEAEEPIHTKQ